MINGMLSDFIHGKIEFIVEDGFSELFFKSCRDKNIVLNNVHNYRNGYIFEIDQDSCDIIKKIADDCGMNSDISAEKGLPRLIRRYKRRVGILVGMLLSAVIVMILSSSVWVIDVQGNEIVSSDEIYTLLEENGIRTGIFSKTILTDDVEFILEKKFPRISWATAAVIGSRLLIEIKERESESSLEDSDSYSNIVAAKDGEIVTADILCGTGKLQIGSPVVKGDLLVSGIVTYKDGRVKPVKAEAIIKARTRNVIVSQTANRISVNKVLTCKDKYLPMFFGLSPDGDMCDKENHFTSNRFFLKSGDIVFPVGVIRQNVIELENTVIENETSKALLIAFSDYAENSVKLYKDVQVIERKITFNIDNQIFIEGEHVCIENIGESRRIFLDEKIKGQ